MNDKMKVWFGLGVLSISLLSVSCSQDETVAGEDVTVEWGVTPAAEGHPFVLPSEAKGAIPFKAAHLQALDWGEVPQGWSVSVNATSDTLWVTAPKAGSAASQRWTLDVTLTGETGNEVTNSFDYYWVSSFDDPKGTFVLNEGNMTTENGSLLYITPEGYVMNDAYKLVNGSELGNVCQDMAFYDGKIYIISQNGDVNPVGTKFENDGMLVILDAKTLKKIDSYKKEDLASLAWPSHIAVLDEEHIYIRDNGVREGDNGSGQIWRLNTKDRSLQVLENTKGVPKAPLYKRGDKLYTFNVGKGLLGKQVNLLEISAASDRVKTYYYHLVDEEIIPAAICPNEEDNTFWFLWKYASDIYSVGKIRLPKYGSLIKMNWGVEMEDIPNDGASGVRFVSSHKDEFYYTTGTHLIKGTFNEPEDTNNPPTLRTEELTDFGDLDKNAREVYNGMGIHPVTGHLYVNTIKGMGTLYTTNTMWEFDLKGDMTRPVNQWSDCTKFPAGFFFWKGND